MTLHLVRKLRLLQMSQKTSFVSVIIITIIATHCKKPNSYQTESSEGSAYKHIVSSGAIPFLQASLLSSVRMLIGPSPKVDLQIKKDNPCNTLNK